MVSERDTESISRAVRILKEAGYKIKKVGKGKDANGGIDFRLDIHAPTKSPWFDPQSSDVRSAAIESDEYGMGGERVTEGSEDG